MTSLIHPTAIVDKGALLGENTRIWHHCHVRENARVGKNCVLGKGVYIDHDVVVGDNCKIQNHVSVYYGVVLEEGVFLGPHVTTTNDLHPRSTENFVSQKTFIRKGASVGANATILCGITIGEYAMVGAGSVVTEDVVPHGLVMGNPAQLVGFVCFCGRRLKIMEKIGEKVKMMCTHCGKEKIIERSSHEKIHSHI